MNRDVFNLLLIGPVIWALTKWAEQPKVLVASPPLPQPAQTDYSMFNRGHLQIEPGYHPYSEESPQVIIGGR